VSTSWITRSFLTRTPQCLDLLNTLVVRGGQPMDLLPSFDSLVDWLVEASLLDATERAEFVEQWGNQSGGEEALEVALQLREAVRDLADLLILECPMNEALVERLNTLLKQLPAIIRLTVDESGVIRRLEPIFEGPVGLLHPVAVSAVELATVLDGSRVGRCEGDECLLYFYDLTRNRSRRWCSMDRCGARAKSAAYYRRQQSASD